MVATTVSQAKSRDRLIRRALAGNALFSALSGAVFIAGSGPISRFTGLEPAWVPAVIGVGVVGWAGLIFSLRRRDTLQPLWVKEIIAGDLAWVAASLGILLTGWLGLTTAGAWTVAILAEIVGLFAIAQYVGLRRMRSER